MKRILFTLLGMLVFSLTQAQITINSTDVPSAGDIVLQAHDNNPDPSVQPGDAGANVMWDLSGLTDDTEDSIYFMNPANTPYGDEFPMANLVMNATDTGYIYLDKNQDYMSWIGMAVDFDTVGTIEVDIVPGYKVADFPVNYGDDLSSSYYWMFTMPTNQPGIDSMRIKMSTDHAYTVDGWGQVMLPMGTYDALRFHQTGTTVDSLWIKTGGMWMFTTRFTFDSESYYWWSNDPDARYVVATLDLDENGNVMGATYMKSGIIQSVGEHQQVERVARVYPNPVRNFVNLDFSRNFEGKLRLMDLTGKTISTREMNGMKAKIDLRQRPEGFYIYEIEDSNGQNVQTGKIIKQ